MNVKELIEQLRQMPDEMEVKFAYNYGDYWKTEVAADVDRVTTGEVTYSEYHRMDKLADEQNEDDVDEEELEEWRKQFRTVVVLGS